MRSKSERDAVRRLNRNPVATSLREFKRRREELKVGKVKHRKRFYLDEEAMYVEDDG